MKRLSNQAQWYLNGSFPVYVIPAVGHASVEPKAMQELVDAGLIYYWHDILLGDYWDLTAKGRIAKDPTYKA